MSSFSYLEDSALPALLPECPMKYPINLGDGLASEDCRENLSMDTLLEEDVCDVSPLFHHVNSSRRWPGRWSDIWTESGQHQEEDFFQEPQPRDQQQPCQQQELESYQQFHEEEPHEQQPYQQHQEEQSHPQPREEQQPYQQSQEQQPYQQEQHQEEQQQHQEEQSYHQRFQQVQQENVCFQQQIQQEQHEKAWYQQQLHQAQHEKAWYEQQFQQGASGFRSYHPTKSYRHLQVTHNPYLLNERCEWRVLPPAGMDPQCDQLRLLELAFNNRSVQVSGSFELATEVNLASSNRGYNPSVTMHKRGGDYLNKQECIIEDASTNNGFLVDKLVHEIKDGVQRLVQDPPADPHLAMRGLFPVTFFPHEHHQVGMGNTHLAALVRNVLDSFSVSRDTPLGEAPWMAPLSIYFPRLPQSLFQFDPEEPDPVLSVLLVSPRILYDKLHPCLYTIAGMSDLLGILHSMMAASEMIAVFQSTSTHRHCPWFGGPDHSLLPSIITTNLGPERRAFIKSVLYDEERVVVESIAKFLEQTSLLPPDHNLYPASVYVAHNVKQTADRKFHQALLEVGGKKKQEKRERRKKGKRRKRGSKEGPPSKSRKRSSRVAADEEDEKEREEQLQKEKEEQLQKEKEEQLQKKKEELVDLMLGMANAVETRGPPLRTMESILRKERNQSQIRQRAENLGGGEAETSAALYSICNTHMLSWQLSLPVSVDFWRPLYRFF